MTRDIFTWDNFKTYFKISSGVGLFIISINLYLINTAMNQMVTNTTHDIYNILKYEGMDNNLICIGSDCSYIDDNGIIYKPNKQMILKEANNVKLLKESFNCELLKVRHVHTYDGIQINSCFYLGNGYIKINIPELNYTVITQLNNHYEHLILNSIVILILFLLMFTISFLKYLYDKQKTEILETYRNNTKLENKYQKVISESAHHEMMIPVATIKTMSEELYKLFFNNICTSSCDGRCLNSSLRCENENTSKCLKLFDNEVITQSSKYFDKIENSIQQLEVVLHQMSETKYFKYSNGDKNIYELIDSICSTMKVFSIDKFEPGFINKELMYKYSVYNISNGEFLNVLSNHITNSIEAKAKQIIFQAELLDEYGVTLKDNSKVGKYINIYIIDNGIGIRNGYNEIISKSEQENIFKAGISTKDKKGNHLVINEKRSQTELNILKRLFYKFMKFEDLKETDKSFRGIGLYVNKTQLQNYGGDISLEETTENGTVFKITIPIKKTRKVDNQEKSKNQQT